MVSLLRIPLPGLPSFRQPNVALGSHYSVGLREIKKKELKFRIMLRSTVIPTEKKREPLDTVGSVIKYVLSINIEALWFRELTTQLE